MLGAAARFIPFLVLVLAVVVGVIGRVKPEVFLKIPRYGFIPWALTGNPMPPYFDDSCLYKENWSGRKGDVLISSGVKAGTFWIHSIVFLLRSQGRDDYETLVDIFGACEMIRYPGHSLASRLEEDRHKRQVAEAEGFHGFQIFTAHHAPGENPKYYGVDPEKNPDVKYIAIDLPNVLLLHYRNLRTDTAATIEQIARFLEIPLSEDLLVTVLHKSRLEYMSHSSRADKYLFRLGYPGAKPFTHVYPQTHVRPGGGLLVNDNDTSLTDTVAQAWEAAIWNHARMNRANPSSNIGVQHTHDLIERRGEPNSRLIFKLLLVWLFFWYGSFRTRYRQPRVRLEMRKVYPRQVVVFLV
eukprot:scaffold3402_cov169-Amphora_coffeaeformis.AAC.8